MHEGYGVHGVEISLIHPPEQHVETGVLTSTTPSASLLRNPRLSPYTDTSPTRRLGHRLSFRPTLPDDLLPTFVPSPTS